jgi:hypothetical protein
MIECFREGMADHYFGSILRPTITRRAFSRRALGYIRDRAGKPIFVLAVDLSDRNDMERPLPRHAVDSRRLIRKSSGAFERS